MVCVCVYAKVCASKCVLQVHVGEQVRVCVHVRAWCVYVSMQRWCATNTSVTHDTLEEDHCDVWQMYYGVATIGRLLKID